MEENGLHIMNITEEDNGDYECQTTDLSGSLKKRDITVNVFSNIRFKSPDYSSQKGKRFTK